MYFCSSSCRSSAQRPGDRMAGQRRGGKHLLQNPHCGSFQETCHDECSYEAVCRFTQPYRHVACWLCSACGHPDAFRTQVSERQVESVILHTPGHKAVNQHKEGPYTPALGRYLELLFCGRQKVASVPSQPPLQHPPDCQVPCAAVTSHPFVTCSVPCCCTYQVCCLQHS